MAVLTPTELASLAGSSWAVRSVNNAQQAVVGVPAGVTITARFGADGARMATLVSQPCAVDTNAVSESVGTTTASPRRGAIRGPAAASAGRTPAGTVHVLPPVAFQFARMFPE